MGLIEQGFGRLIYQNHLSFKSCSDFIQISPLFVSRVKLLQPYSLTFEMSDDEADPELLELLRQSLLGKQTKEDEPETGVLESVEYVYDNSIDVAIEMRGTKSAAETIYQQMQEKQFSTASWSDHELHPKAKDEATVAFIFTMDLLNFSFWSELPSDERFAIEYKGQHWTGYWSLVAAMQRALEEGKPIPATSRFRRIKKTNNPQGIPITDPHYWHNEEECNMESLRHIFRSSTEEEMPLLEERLECLRESGKVLYEVCSPHAMQICNTCMTFCMT